MQIFPYLATIKILIRKTLKAILSIACMTILFAGCGQKEGNEKKSDISVTLSSTEITITNAQPVDVSYTVKGYDGEVTAKLGSLPEASRCPTSSTARAAKAS